MCVRIHLAGLRMGADKELLALGDGVDLAIGVDQAALFAGSFIPVYVCIDTHICAGIRTGISADAGACALSGVRDMRKTCVQTSVWTHVQTGVRIHVWT